MPREGIRAFQARRDHGETTAQTFAEACLVAIAARNPQLNAFVRVDSDGACAAARASDERRRRGATLGPLDGVPLAIKDNIDVAGLPAASGIAALSTRVPPHDAACIARLRAQGAVFLGKTLMDEAALGAHGDNPTFGRCHNPLAHGYTAGGSSSGSAAAVAAGLCAAALGTDTLGSVRIPASYCGIVGYVSSRGLVDAAGVMPLAASLDRVGVLARSVADAALVAEALSDGIRVAPAPAVSVGVLRGLDSVVPAEILAAVDGLAHALGRNGHRIVDVASGAFDWTGVRRAAFLMIEVEGAGVHAALLDDPGANISAYLRAALEYGRRASADRIERAKAQIDAARAAISGWLAQCDVLLLPTTPQVAFPFDGEVPSTQGDLTAPASIAGLPAISVPAGALAGGLPVGAQLVAGNGRDALLLGVAASLD
jgi:aspartyl-tRNA(Asn)/glutamyl-tRNA(Gln) amidotransferase subunit A